MAKAVMAGVLKKGAATADWGVAALDKDAAAATLQADVLTAVRLQPTTFVLYIQYTLSIPVFSLYRSICAA